MTSPAQYQPMDMCYLMCFCPHRYTAYFTRDWEWFVTDAGGLYHKRGQQWYTTREIDPDRHTRQLVYNGQLSTHIKLHH